jgi:transposase
LLPSLDEEHAWQTECTFDVPQSAAPVFVSQEVAMDTVFNCVAGLDIHKKTILACIRSVNKQGKVSEQVRTFGTMTRDLLSLHDWMTSQGVTHAAMESTGVFWKPVWNILEGGFELLLVNARELKQVPGRKSDVKDCQWIARLTGCGLLKSSFVPDRLQRHLRDLTRHRAQLVSEHTRIANRIHKLLEDANIKLGSVASDILGKSGRRMLEALREGQRDPRRLADLALGRLKKKIPELRRALEGHFTEHHAFMLQQLLDHLEYLETKIAEFDARIEEELPPFLPSQTLERLQAVPGLDRRTIENIVVEIGTDMSQFPTAGHLSSWAGVSPGNEQSAGKRKRGKTTKGNHWLQRALGEAAWAASRTKDTYFRAQYGRLAGRRGKKRAIVAVGHSLLVVIYMLLKHELDYEELGANYFDTREPERLQRYLVKRLKALGFDVTLTPSEFAA